MSDNSQREDQAKVGDDDSRVVSADRLNKAIGVLTRREVEARILAPVIEALGKEFGEERVVRVIRDTIIRIARAQGDLLAQEMGGRSLSHFADSLKAWTQDDALELDVLEQSDDDFAFNVTRCRYAELYRELGISELGSILSCGRDFALIEGFNPNISLSRTQTIMDGAPYCDFRYTRNRKHGPSR
jgi:hypothetical protein